jgi:GNAT superfamily N-acetyltransferase
MVQIVPVESPTDKRAFLRLPERLYANDPNWVCPLRIERRDFFDARKNPFFENADVQLFLARRDGRNVGRISAHVYHNHNNTHGERTGFFGFFECEYDYAIAEALLARAAACLKDRGMERMRGPANFTTNHEIGLVVDGFDRPPVIMMTYNPPFYPEFAERFGLKKVMDVYAYYTEDTNPTPERVVKLIDRIRKRSGTTIRPLDLSQFDDEVKRVKSIYDRAWAPNWGFVPMTDAEFAHMAKDMKQIVDPDIVLFAEVDGEPVGFSMALPDINQALIHLKGRLLPFGLIKLLWLLKVRKIVTGIRVLVMGVLPEYQRRGIDNLLYHETFTRGVAKGYRSAETSWILETNEMMNRAAENLGHRRYKTYRMYEMGLR